MVTQLRHTVNCVYVYIFSSSASPCFRNKARGRTSQTRVSTAVSVCHQPSVVWECRVCRPLLSTLSAVLCALPPGSTTCPGSPTPSSTRWCTEMDNSHWCQFTSLCAYIYRPSSLLPLSVGVLYCKCMCVSVCVREREFVCVCVCVCCVCVCERERVFACVYYTHASCFFNKLVYLKRIQCVYV